MFALQRPPTAETVLRPILRPDCSRVPIAQQKIAWLDTITGAVLIMYRFQMLLRKLQERGPYEDVGTLNITALRLHLFQTQRQTAAPRTRQ